MGSPTEGIVLCVGHFHGEVGMLYRGLICVWDDNAGEQGISNFTCGNSTVPVFL